MSRNIKIYQFEELTKQARKKAIDHLRNINTDHNWWETVYLDFEAICSLIGVEVELKKTWFRGFCSQGDGACFTATVNIVELIQGINNKTYLQHAPQLEKEVTSFAPQSCTVDSRVISLIQRHQIDLEVAVRPGNNSNRSIPRFEWNNVGANVDQQLCDLERWFTEIVKKLDNLLYRLLENEDTYLTSDEKVAEEIIEAEYEFFEDGTQYKLIIDTKYRRVSIAA
jgi:hypothetical protein